MSWVDKHAFRDIPSKGREMVSGTVKKILRRRAQHGLTQGVAGVHVRKNKGTDLEPRPVGAQLEHRLDNSRMFLFEKMANTFGETR